MIDDSKIKIFNLPTSHRQIFSLALKLYFRDLRFYLAISFLCMLLTSPLLLVLKASSSSIMQFNIALNLFESFCAILLNGLVMACLPNLVEKDFTHTASSLKILLSSFLGKVILMATVYIVILFFVINFLPAISLLVGIIFIFVPLVCFLQPNKSVFSMFSESALISIKQGLHLILFLLLSSGLFFFFSTVIVLFFIIVSLFLSFLGIDSLSGMINQLLDFNNLLAEEQSQLLQNFLSSYWFILIYGISQMFFLPLKSLLVCLFFIKSTRSHYMEDLIKFWHLFGYEEAGSAEHKI